MCKIIACLTCLALAALFAAVNLPREPSGRRPINHAEPLAPGSPNVLRDQAEAVAAAHRFARSFLPVIYGRSPATSVEAAWPELRRQLVQRSPTVSTGRVPGPFRLTGPVLVPITRERALARFMVRSKSDQAISGLEFEITFRHSRWAASKATGN